MKRAPRSVTGPAILVLGTVFLQGCYLTHLYDAIAESPVTGDASALSVAVALVAGDIVIDRADGGHLYELNLRYCRTHFEPRVSRTSTEGRAALTVGMKRHRENGHQPLPGGERNRLDLDLTGERPVDLRLDLGAGKHHAQLGGLRLRSLDIDTGAGPATIGFDRPTAGELERFRINGGPGGVRLLGLGNASPADLALSAGAGEFEVDLNGPWDKDGLVRLNVRLGDVTVIMPEQIGLTVLAEGRDPADLILPEFTRDEQGGLRSPGYERARRRITIIFGPGLGVLEVRRNR